MFDFNVKLMGNMSVTVVAENKEEAERKLSNRDEVEIKNSNVITELREKNIERGAER